MKRACVVLSLLAVSAGLASAAQLRPLDQNANPSRTLDRTFLCSTVSIFGERFLQVGMTSPKSLPTGKNAGGASVYTGSAGASQMLAGLTAGPAYGRPIGEVYYNKTRCRVTPKSIPLTSRGLPGPPVPFDQYLRCPAGRRVLVRIRAALDRRVTWRATRNVVRAKANSSTAALAVRTEAGRPIAFFTLDSGKTKLWTAGGCTN